MSNDNFPTYPGWETVREIGRGSYGAVYEIKRELPNETERAALKLISIPQSSSALDELRGEGMDEESITNTFKEYLKSFMEEYSLMRRLSGNSNVVNCDDVRYVQHDDGIGWDIFIKMELLTPLTRSLGKTVTEKQALQIGTDICRALVLCRRENIIHRDIKPANIFVSRSGVYKLGDFGIAKTIEKTTGGTKAGTYDYMAPEVYHDEPYGFAADIYSLGMVLYWLLNGRRGPFLAPGGAAVTTTERDAARKRRFSGEPLPPPAFGSEALKRIVLKACAYEPRDRYQSPEELLADLEAVGRAPFAPAAPAAPVGTSSARPSIAPEPEDGTVGAFKAPAAPVEASSARPSIAPEPEDGTVGAFKAPAAPVGTSSARPSIAPKPEDGTVGIFHKPAPKAPPAPEAPAQKPEAPAPEPPAPVDPPKPEAPAPAEPKKGGKKGLLIGIIGGLVALAAVLLFVLLPKGGSGNSENFLESPGVITPADAPETASAPAEVPDIKLGFIILRDENSAYSLAFINAAMEACNSSGVEYIMMTNVPEGQECYEAALKLIDQGCDFIFGNSYGYESYLLQVAKEFPNVQFCTASGILAHTEGLTNYHNSFASIYEGRYLTGVAAGMKLNQMIENGQISPREAKVGFIGSFNYAEVISAYTAFFLGARSVCPSATMEVIFTSSWDDPSMEAEDAKRLINNGCVLISQYSDSAGAPFVCEEYGVPNVAYGSSYRGDFPNTALVSSRINWSPYFTYVISSMQNGTPIASDWAGGVSTGAVELLGLNESAAAPGTAEALEAAKAGLANRTVLVFDTSTFTVGGVALTGYLADVDYDPAYTADTEAIIGGYFHESEFRSAPYFDIPIDGITLLNTGW